MWSIYGSNNHNAGGLGISHKFGLFNLQLCYFFAVFFLIDMINSICIILTDIPLRYRRIPALWVKELEVKWTWWCWHWPFRHISLKGWGSTECFFFVKESIVSLCCVSEKVIYKECDERREREIVLSLPQPQICITQTAYRVKHMIQVTLYNLFVI